jgi:hypothetical protein
METLGGPFAAKCGTHSLKKETLDYDYLRRLERRVNSRKKSNPLQQGEGWG